MSNPQGGVLTVGADTCLPPAGDEPLRLRCQTIPTTNVAWTLGGSLISTNEFIDVTNAGEYTCSASDGCGQTLTATSEVLRKYATY